MSLFGADRDRERGPRSAQERVRARLEREARRRGVPVESLAPEPSADAADPRPEPEPFDGADAVQAVPERELRDEVAREDEPVEEVAWKGEPVEEVAWEGEPVEEVAWEGEPVEEVAWEGEPVGQVSWEEPAEGSASQDEPVEAAWVPEPPEEVVSEEPEDVAFQDSAAEEPPPDGPVEDRVEQPAGSAAVGPARDAPTDERVRAAASVPVEQSTVEWTALERSLVEDPGPPSGNGTGSHEPVASPQEEPEETAISSANPAVSDGASDAPVAPRVARLRANRSAPGSRFRRPERPAAGADGPRTPRRGRRKTAERGPRPSGGARKWITRVVVPLLIVAVLAFGWFVISLYQPFTGSGGDTVRVSVPSGLSTRQIGDLLADKGVVDSGFFFALKARIDGNKGSLEAGAYTFRKGMSYEDAQAILLKGPPPIRTVSLRLPEGNTERDYARAVDKSGKVRGKYLRAVRRARFNPRRYGAPAGSPLEGFLFPATYELNKKNATAKALVGEQLATFKRNFRRVPMGKARRANLSPYEVLVIASMVEREAQLARERPIIAGVIYNRLRQGIPLGIDATIRYATNNWTRPIRQSQLDAPGRYNTRLNQGLPPTPIGNPSLASIRAAASPKATGYLFFVVKPGGDGAHAFSRTDAQFQRDVARYNNARTAAGGRDPK